MSSTVSIVLPTYNGEKFLKESIESCLCQTFKDLELIVVVDGSIDGTMNILSEYKDPRIKIKYTRNQGLPQALNEGFALAQGEYWTWTSDDNLFLPNAIKTMAEFLEINQQTPMVATDIYRINNKGKIIGHSSNQYACFLYRAEAAKKTGLYRSEFTLVEDADFFIRLAYFAGPAKFIHQPLYKYRDHPESLSAKKTSQRQLVSTKMHFDLISRGIEKGDLKELFFDRIRKCALFKDHDTLEDILKFAQEKNIDFISSLRKTAHFIKTPLGWYFNKLFVFLTARFPVFRFLLGN